MIQTWQIFAGWTPPAVVPEYDLEWEPLDVLISYYDEVIRARYRELEPLLSSWDKQLEEYGKDPTRMDWKEFRPLRLSREEDWSDWLAHLISSSVTGVSAAYLFGKKAEDEIRFANPDNVYREISQDGYRADLIVHWQDHSFSHIEVKVGDTSLVKTIGTGKALRKRFDAEESAWNDFILLIDSQLQDWDRIQSQYQDGRKIAAIKWDDVAVALRRGLIVAEPISWKAWAYAFIGAIEQLLIGFHGHMLETRRPFFGLDKKIAILEKGLDDES